LKLPDGSVYLIGFGIGRIVKECNVCLHGRGRLRRQIVVREAAQHRLAANDKHIRIAGDRGRRAQNMLKLLAGHAACA